MFSRHWSIFDEIRETQAIHLLIEIATLYRIQEQKYLKSNIEFKENVIIERNKLIVGELFQPIGDKKQPLIMYEACNKIIHAETINFDLRKLPNSHLSYLYPRIYIYGKKNKIKWRAILDIQEFCEKAMRI